MKTSSIILIVCFGLISTQLAPAQPGQRGGRRPLMGMGMGMGMGGMAGLRLDGTKAQIFGEHTAFSATMEMQTKAGPQGGTPMTVKMARDGGNSRFEMDMSASGGPQTKSMGMDKIVNISRGDKKVNYVVYPGMQAYVENPMQQAEAQAVQSASDAKAGDYKVESTEQGKETVDGHPCVKNKVVITDKDGKKLEATVWNATDLKKFPIKQEYAEGQGPVFIVLYKDVNLEKPDAALFEPPSGFTKYNNMTELMMKRLGGTAPGAAPATAPQR